ncbi:uncharacterized protein LOC113231305 [Hyposmocoma kahamanoa]|uniref:uncharacterized protein LOC113231305 n=1 Tax=Hyposmocoma kahamanoa TaxID=1477025 RepID=UPI000E6D66A9|nr:uncharacterized protein LOC113231305 [Hyposmocoma kahamanoa]
MVRLRTFQVRSAKGLFRGLVQRGLNIEALNNLTLGSIFFNLCEACQVQTMASIPPSAFSAGRIRETQRDMKVSNPSKGSRNDSGKFFNTSMIESPLKYNSKLMNSIWGFYNRYSPHNVKKINDAFTFNVELEQSATNSTTTTDKKDTGTKLPTSKFDNMWAALNLPQLH